MFRLIFYCLQTTCFNFNKFTWNIKIFVNFPHLLAKYNAKYLFNILDKITEQILKSVLNNILFEYAFCVLNTYE